MSVDFRTVGGGFDHPEGVAFSDDHGLFCGGEAGQIYSVDLETGESRIVADTGGFILGLAFGPEGKLFACDMGRSSVLQIDVTTGDVEDFSGSRSADVSVPNYLAFTKMGDLYVSDSGSWGADDGRVLLFPAEGGDARVVASGLAYANGLAVSVGGTELYVVESSTPAVTRVSIDDSDYGNRSRIVEMPGTVPDGVAVCRDGSLVIACYRPDAVYSWSPGAGLSILAEDPTGLTMSAPTNVAFAGRDRNRLVTANLAGYHLTELTGSGLQGVVMEYTH